MKTSAKHFGPALGP